MRRLIHLAEQPPMPTPLILLGALREIDPTVELVHFGAVEPLRLPRLLLGRGPVQDWRLGAVRPTRRRAQMGEVLLEGESHRAVKNMKNVLLGQLAMQGFAQIAQYLSMGEPGSAPTYDDEGQGPIDIVEDFRIRDFEWRRNQGEDVFARRADASEGGPESRALDAKMMDHLHTDGRAEFRRSKRGALITNIWGGSNGQ